MYTQPMMVTEMGRLFMWTTVSRPPNGGRMDRRPVPRASHKVYPPQAGRRWLPPRQLAEKPAPGSSTVMTIRTELPPRNSGLKFGCSLCDYRSSFGVQAGRELEGGQRSAKETPASHAELNHNRS